VEGIGGLSSPEPFGNRHASHEVLLWGKTQEPRIGKPTDRSDATQQNPQPFHPPRASPVRVGLVDKAVAVYAHLEDSFKLICRYTTHLGLTTKAVPPKGFHLSNAKEFLTAIDVSGNQFDLSQFGAEWNEIYDGWRNIRNCIVHDNGVVEVHYAVPISDTPAGIMTPPSEETADAEAIKSFVAGRTDVRISLGMIEVETTAVESIMTASKAAVAKVIAELVRIAPPTAPEPPRRVR